MALTAIILAGGKSSRMGQDKGLMDFNGRPMIQSVLDLVAKYTGQILIISNRDEDYKAFGFPVYKDVFVDCGPLAGIHSGLVHSGTDKNLFLTCDSPFVEESLINELLNHQDEGTIVYPLLNKKKFPLTALYHKSVLPLVEQHLQQKELMVKKLLEAANSKEIKLDASFNRQLVNLNSRNDIEPYLNQH